MPGDIIFLNCRYFIQLFTQIAVPAEAGMTLSESAMHLWKILTNQENQYGRGKPT